MLLVSDGCVIGCTLRVSGSDEVAELALITVYLEGRKNHLKLNRIYFVLIKPRKSSSSGVHALNSRLITKESATFVLLPYEDNKITCNGFSSRPNGLLSL